MAEINVYISSDIVSTEKRILLTWTFEHFKQRLEQITGIPPQDQQIELRVGSETTQLDAAPNTPLTQFQLQAFCHIHVHNTNEQSVLHTLDDPDVEGFKLSEQEYQRRTDSVRQWKKDNKLGEFDPERMAKIEEQKQLNNSKATQLTVGSRCRIMNSIRGERRGVLKFVGEVPCIDNQVWCGVEFDEPDGKNDGSINGTRYFTAKQNYGSFVKPQHVETGDWPPLFDDEFSDDEI